MFLTTLSGRSGYDEPAKARLQVDHDERPGAAKPAAIPKCRFRKFENRTAGAFFGQNPVKIIRKTPMLKLGRIYAASENMKTAVFIETHGVLEAVPVANHHQVSPLDMKQLSLNL